MIHLLLTLLLSPLLRLFAGRAHEQPARVLVIQLAKIGDLLCSTPVFRELKRCYPVVELSVLATKINAPLLRCNPRVDHVVEADARQFRGLAGKWRLIALLRRGRYDTVICLNAGAAYATAALWAGIPRRLAVLSNFGGSTHRLAAHLWTDVEPHQGDRLIQATYLALLERLGVRDGSIAKEVFPAPGAAEKVSALLDSNTGPLLGIGVSSANRLKALGNEKIIELARRMLTAYPGLSVILIGGPEDAQQACEIRQALPSERVIDSCGKLGLAELPALLEKLSTYLGVDSGVTYMADAVGIPVVSVAGPCNMEETRPTGKRVVIIQRAELPCQPCAHIFKAPYSCWVGTRACIVDVSAAEIAAAVSSLLSVGEKL